MNFLPTLGIRRIRGCILACCVLLSQTLISQTAPITNIDFGCQGIETIVSIYPLDNDQPGSSDFDPMSLSIVVAPKYGVASVNYDNVSIEYQWTGLEYGLDAFTYSICNEEGLCSQNTIDLFIKGGNTVIVEDDHYVGLPGSVIKGRVTKNDYDLEGDGWTITLMKTTDYGSLSFNGSGGFTYNAASNFTGYDFGEYKICDDNIDQACATAILGFYIEPVKLNGAKTQMDYRTAYSVIADNVLSTNALTDYVCLNIKKSDVVCSMSVSPQHGTAVVNADGSFSYTPYTGFIGSDQFDLSICDVSDNTCISSKVLISVVENTYSCNVTPARLLDDVALGKEDNSISGKLLSNDYNLVQGYYELSTTPINGPENGSVLIDSDGSYVYTPDPGFFGSDKFDYQVSILDTDPTLTNHIVSQPEDLLINNFSSTSLLDFSGYGAIYDVNLINLSMDHNDISQTAIQLISPSGTSRFMTVSPCVNDANASTEIDINFDDAAATDLLPCPPNDGGTYQSDKPLSSFNGEESNGQWKLNVLNYQPGINDGTLKNWGLEITTIDYKDLGFRRATASILIMPTVKSPVALPDCYDVNPGVALNVNPLENDFDEDYDIDIKSVRIIDGPNSGTATVEDNGTITYYNPSSMLTEEISYEICDTLGLCDVSTIKFQVSLVVGLDLLSFDVSDKGNGNVALKWNTANEDQVSHFVIERKTEKSFEGIAIVDAQNRIENEYTYLDVVSSRTSSAYYRIKFVDLDGSSEYSDIKRLQWNQSSELVMGPNPTSDRLFIKHSYQHVNQVWIKNAAGQHCMDVSPNNDGSFEINVTELLPGNYYLILSADNVIETTSFVKI